MATAKAKTDLEHLSQTDAAWLIDRKASWLREHANLVRRNQDGSYNGRDLVAAVLCNLSPATLSDEHLTAVTVIAESAYELAYAAPGCVRVLREIVQAHGGAGLAAVGQIMLETCERILREHPPTFKTEEEIRVAHEAAANREIASLASQQATSDLRFVEVCESCDRYRWGKSWKKKPIPTGYVTTPGLVCPDCSF